MLKKLLIGLVVILALLGLGGYFLTANLDSIVRAAIEKYGTEATKTVVKLNQVKIILTSGEANLFGLSVGSPAGYAAKKSLYLGSVSVKMDPNTLSGSGPIVIQTVRIDKPQVTFEIAKGGDNNLQAIANNAKAYAASFSNNKDKTPKQEPTASTQSGRKIVINDLTITDGQIAITQEMLQGKELSAKLPAIHLTNIGKSEGGATSADIAQKLLTAIANSAAQAATSSLAKELGSSVQKAGSEAVEETTKKAGSALKGLLKK